MLPWILVVLLRGSTAGRVAARVSLAATVTTGAACGLDSEGLTGGSAGLPEATGSSSDGSSATEGEGSGTSAATGDSESTTTASATTSDATTSDASGPAVLELDPIFDFGSIAKDGTLPGTLMVTNTGERAADAINLPPLVAPFEIVGEDCTPSLEPGATCTVSLEFSPVVLGPFEGILRLNYDNGPATMQSSSELTGRSTGTTENLVLNPGAEAGGSPPQGWTPTVGANWGVVTEPVRSGSSAFKHGQTLVFGENRLDQVVDVSSHAAAADVGELRAQIQGFLIGEGGLGDVGRISVEFRNGNQALGSVDIVDGSPSSWSGGTFDDFVPPMTRQIRIRLGCQITGGVQQDCNVAFDDLSLIVSYE